MASKAKSKSKAKAKPAAPKSTLKRATNKFVKGTIRGVETWIENIETDAEIEDHEFIGDPKKGTEWRGGRNVKKKGNIEGTPVKVVFTPKGVIVVPECGDAGLAIDKATLLDLAEQAKKTK